MTMQHMLSTNDNPFDPFTEFNEWYTWDTTAGYHSTAFLSRVVKSSEELGEGDEMLAIEQGIDEIVLNDILDVYIKVSKDVDSSLKTSS